ncbi:unnamed protein product [Ectocarpus sp. 12 AP-2014]
MVDVASTRKGQRHSYMLTNRPIFPRPSSRSPPPPASAIEVFVVDEQGGFINSFLTGSSSSSRPQSTTTTWVVNRLLFGVHVVLFCRIVCFFGPPSALDTQKPSSFRFFASSCGVRGVVLVYQRTR